MRQLFFVAMMGLAFVGLHPKPAHAQWHVFDSASFGQLIKSAATESSQLQTLRNTYGVAQSSLTQLQSFYGSFAHMTDAAQVVPTLLQGSQMYPLEDLAQAEGILRSNGSGFTGNLASSALAVLNQTQYFKSAQSDFSATEMNSQAANSAGQIAAAQLLYQSAQNRISGLEQLKDQLGASADPKQTMDLAARAQIESGVNQAQTQQAAALQMMQQAQKEQVEQRAEQNFRQGAESFEDATRTAAGE
ncbi:type IV secretion system protein [Gluconobacter cerinus]|uniref:type IV secretion system protein n=1 Tax=Gluconobacter cerinus TaxID=38307 RepID=UPI001B8D2BB9|nr:type IV secretion system protein [Gluconobacter cerinus]MBS0984272.1 hypothetical protein [Gluconobacter cerinus]